jgi:hypothetical protein
MILENFACGGLTTTELLNSIRCSSSEAPLYGAGYPTTTQLGAAVAFSNTQKRQIALITVAIGGIDLVQGSPLSTISSNIEMITAQLRAAAGPSVPIIGVCYPDHSLRSWLKGDFGKSVATRSVADWKNTFDPMFTKRTPRLMRTFSTPRLILAPSPHSRSTSHFRPTEGFRSPWLAPANWRVSFP